MKTELKTEIEKGEDFKPFTLEIKIESEAEFLSLLTLTGDTTSKLINEISSVKKDGVVLDNGNYYELYNILEELNFNYFK